MRQVLLPAGGMSGDHLTGGGSRAVSAPRLRRRRPPGRFPAPGEFYRRIIQTTHEGVWMANFHGVTTFVNTQMARMLGVTPAEMAGRPVSDFLFAEDWPTVRRRFANLRKHRTGRELEQRLRRRDGTELWAMVATSVFGGDGGSPKLLGMFTDITDRKRADLALRDAQQQLANRIEQRTGELRASHEALRESEEKYRRLFETISDAAFVFDAEMRRFVEVNEAALHLYGYPRAEFLNLRYGAITTEPEDSETAIRLALAARCSRVPLRYHRRRDGTVFPVEISASTLVLKGRRVVCAIMRDLTHSVELEREILSISEQEQRRLGQDLHDDLCQQLAGVEFLSQALASRLAARGAEGVPQAREIAQMVQRAMTQTRELARGMSPVELKAEGLADALRELAARTAKVFRVDCRFRCDAHVAISNHTAAVHLYRIAQEGVGNALKHAKARRIRLSLATRNENLVLLVRDNGIGLPAEGRNPKGLGLRIMRYRAEVIGGAFAVQRDPSGGTRLVCSVPKRLLRNEGRTRN